MKTFNLEGPTWAFFTPEQMFGEEAKLRAAHKHYINADLYMLTKMNKVFFDTKKTRVTRDGSLSMVLHVGNQEKKEFDKIKLKFPLIISTYTIPSVKETFSSMKECFATLLYRQYVPRSDRKKTVVKIAKGLHRRGILTDKALFKVLMLVYSTEIKFEHKTPYEVSVYDPIIECTTDNEKAKLARQKNPRRYELNDANWDLEKKKEVNFDELPGFNETYNATFMVDQVVNLLDVDVGGQEVIYIGKTEQDDFNRLSAHNKLNKLNALHLRDEYKSNVVHLLGFKHYETIGFSNRNSNIKNSDAISTAEACLINYFKPRDNTHYVDDSGADGWKHRKVLKKKKYTNIKVLLDIDGQYTKFYTKHLGHQGKNSHDFEFRI
ncbi:MULTISPECIES: hypothetical protein [unclassified Agarivorans]|nr:MULTISPECIES: hypothetical protein [unclassified Agarivorans]MDO6684507.1 hypothetical protein [Agarivorans sp. 3_MG-2023]MDO6714672.1 hypothetical protein [Agarivorans sp. 2_MG-2023]